MSKYSHVLQRHGLPTSPLVSAQRGAANSPPSAGSPRLGSLDVDFNSRLLLAEIGVETSPTGPASAAAERRPVKSATASLASCPYSVRESSGRPTAEGAMSEGELVAREDGYLSAELGTLQQAMEGAEQAEREGGQPRRLDFSRQRMRERLLRNKGSR
mmetsp:Transcript_12359/g.31667  ORF Transcript_12359/g.31667 Transcript_12359/m.31667 type:complete len:158 (+) Transcript_12359:288-761(+)|eukprot:jgi/Tetstr1/440011/TSEL_028372.t1